MASDYKEHILSCPGISGAGAGDSTVGKRTEALLCEAVSETFVSGYFRWGYGYIMAYDGRRYAALDERDVKTLIYNCLRRNGVGDVYRANSVNKIQNMVEFKVHDRPYAPRQELLSFENCVLNLETGMSYPHGEEWETNSYMDYPYDSTAQCPRWNIFLSEIMPGPDACDVVQEFCGALFVDRHKYLIKNILFLIGDGNNGKSVFLDSIKNALGGSENVTGFEIKDIISNPNAAYAANGKLANICGDMSKSDISGGAFKRYVAGEPIVAKRLYTDTFLATELPLMLVAVNEMPTTTDQTEGHWTRPLPVPFNMRISEEKKDPQLAGKLKAERSGIFNWILEGRRRFLKNGAKFSKCSWVENEREKMRIDSNTILQFIVDTGMYPKDNPMTYEEKVQVSVIYTRYREYCRENSIQNMYGRKQFSATMAREGYEKKRNSVGEFYVVWYLNQGKTRADVDEYFKNPPTKVPREEKMDESAFWDTDRARDEVPF